MKCKSCGFDNPAGFAFCGKCGTPLSSGCPKCGFESPEGFTFCGKCGTPLESTPDTLTPTDLDHLRTYLPSTLIESLRFDLSSPAPALLEECLTHLSRLLDTIYTHLPPYLVEWVIQDPTPGRIEHSLAYDDRTLLTQVLAGLRRKFAVRRVESGKTIRWDDFGICMMNRARKSDIMSLLEVSEERPGRFRRAVS